MWWVSQWATYCHIMPLYHWSHMVTFPAWFAAAGWCWWCPPAFKARGSSSRLTTAEMFRSEDPCAMATWGSCEGWHGDALVVLPFPPPNKGWSVARLFPGDLCSVVFRCLLGIRMCYSCLPCSKATKRMRTFCIWSCSPRMIPNNSRIALAIPSRMTGANTPQRQHSGWSTTLLPALAQPSLCHNLHPPGSVKQRC